MRPPTATRPEVGFTIPESSRRRVVLPEPLRPTSPTALPGSTANETSRSATDVRAARAAGGRGAGPSARGSRADRRGSVRAACSTRISPSLTQATVPPAPAGRSRRGVRTNAGSSFGISIRSSRTPSSSASSTASTSRSQRISRWSETKPTGRRARARHRAPAGRAGGRGCRGRARARPSATRSGTRTTSRRRPAALGDEPGRLEQLLLVRIAHREDALRQRVRGEDDVRVGAAHPVGEQLDEAGLVVPAVDEAKLGAAVERRFELVAVALDRERRVVRREHEADDRARRLPRRPPRAASAMRGVQCFMPV